MKYRFWSVAFLVLFIGNSFAYSTAQSKVKVSNEISDDKNEKQEEGENKSREANFSQASDEALPITHKSFLEKDFNLLEVICLPIVSQTGKTSNHEIQNSYLLNVFDSCIQINAP